MPRASTRTHSSSIPLTAAALSGPRRVEEPTTTSSGTLPHQALYDGPDSEVVELQRWQRSRTPSERGQIRNEDVAREKAGRAKRMQTRARKPKSAKEGKGASKGKGKRRAASQGSQGFTTDADDDDDDDELGGDKTGLGNVGAHGSVADPQELEELIGDTYADELDDPELCADLSDEIQKLVGGDSSSYTRQDLKAALKLVRSGDSQAPNGATEQQAQGNELPQLAQKALEDGNDIEPDAQPQSGSKRSLVAAPTSASKRTRLNRSCTTSTVIERSRSPTPPSLGNKLTRAKPLGLPVTTARLGTRGQPGGLPGSAAFLPQGPSQAQARTSQALLARSPSPLPASFRGGLDLDVEDTQTIPEDTQTVPEETMVEPPLVASASLPPESALRSRAGTSTRPTPNVAASSSPELATPPGVAAARRTAAQSVPSQPRPLRPITVRPALPLAPTVSPEQANEKRSRHFDRNERNRVRAQEFLKAWRSQGNSDEGELLEEDEAEKMEQQNISRGKPTKRKPKAGLKCQPGRPGEAASLAVTDVTAYSFAVGPYVTRGSGLILSIESFQRSFATLFPGMPFEEANANLIGAICDRLPGGRTVVKKNIRPVIKNWFGFKEDPMTEADVDFNIKLHNSMREDFHFGSLVHRKTHYESPVLLASFLAGFFEASHSPCAVFHTYFNPVRVETFATLLTMMECCIAEWRTGREVKEHLNSKDQAIMYEKHLINMQVFAKAAPKRFYEMSIDFHAAGVRKSVRPTDPEVSVKPTIRLEDIRPDTPSPSPSRAASPSPSPSPSRAASSSTPGHLGSS